MFQKGKLSSFPHLNLSFLVWGFSWLIAEGLAFQTRGNFVLPLLLESTMTLALSI